MSKKIFFSWQSDLPRKTHKNFIEMCIKTAVEELGTDEEVNIYMDYDRDTKDMVGSPDISSTIFEKIEKSVLFICDISIINSEYDGRKTPNPNVLIELGFAVKCLGWDKVICIFDNNSGKIEDLPFDLRQKRVMTYDSKDNIEKKHIISALRENIKSLFVSGKLFNPLNDYMKARIDKNLLEVSKQFSNILFNSVSMSDGLANTINFLKLSDLEIKNKLLDVKFPDFLFLNTYEKVISELREIFKELLSSTYFSKEWSYTILNFIEWIRQYKYIVSERNPIQILEYITEEPLEEYVIVSGKSINQENSINLQLIFEPIYENGRRFVDSIHGKVINITQYPKDALNPLGKLCKFNRSEIDVIYKCFCEFQEICKSWLDITDSEFILDPDYYIIT